MCSLFEASFTNITCFEVLKVGGEAAFHPDAHGSNHPQKKKKRRKRTKKLSTGCILAVSFRQLTLGEVSQPQEHIGTLTRGSTRAARKLSFATKFIIPAVQVFTNHRDKYVLRYSIYLVVATANLAAHALKPPFRNGGLNRCVLLVQVIAWFGSLVAWLHALEAGFEDQNQNAMLFYGFCVLAVVAFRYNEPCRDWLLERRIRGEPDSEKDGHTLD
jgi:hypothetical protein